MPSHVLSLVPSWFLTPIALLSGLARLDLIWECFDPLPLDLFTLTQLEHLSIQSRWEGLNSVSREVALPEQLSQLSNLSRLTFIQRKCRSLPSALGFLPKLQHLHIKAQGLLQHLPDSFSQLTQLTALELNLLALQEIPGGLVGFTKLQRLQLLCPDMLGPPEGVGECASLHQLIYDSATPLRHSFFLGMPVRSSEYQFIPSSITQLTQLEHLELNFFDNRLRDGPGLEALTGLTQLSFTSGWRIKSPVSTFENFRNLRAFFWSCWYIEALPGGLEQLTGLTRVAIASPGDKDEYIGMSSLADGGSSRDQRLQLLPCRVTGELQPFRSVSVLGPDYVESDDWLLDLFHAALDTEDRVSLSKTVQHLPMLNSLRLHFTEEPLLLPPGILQAASQLQQLEFECKDLLLQPGSLAGLSSSLTRLSFRCKALYTLPSDIAQLGALREFEVVCGEHLQLNGEGSEEDEDSDSEGGAMKCDGGRGGDEGIEGNTVLAEELIPEEVWYGFSKLQCLHLSLPNHESQQFLPEGLWGLTSLKKLRLLQQWLTKLPEQISCLSQLQQLELLGCRSLHSLPDGLGQLQQLRWLVLEAPSLTELPASLGGCTSLQELVLRCEELLGLPSSIGELQRLKRLELRCTDGRGLQKGLPVELSSLGQLKVLEVVTGAPVRHWPVEASSWGQLSSLTELVIGFEGQQQQQEREEKLRIGAVGCPSHGAAAGCGGGSCDRFLSLPMGALSLLESGQLQLVQLYGPRGSLLPGEWSGKGLVNRSQGMFDCWQKPQPHCCPSYIYFKGAI